MHKGDYRLKFMAEADGYSLLDKKQAAKYLNISVQTLQRHMANGLIVYIKVGSLVRFRLEDLQAYVGKNIHGA